MTGGPDPAGYARTREEILKRYQELEAAQRDAAYRQTRFEEVCRQLPPELRPDASVVERAKQQMVKFWGYVTPLLSDLAFPWYAYLDSRRWTNINGASVRLSNVLTKMETHGQSADALRTTVPQQLIAGDGYPGRGVREFPWAGIAGDAYRSRIPYQRQASDRLGTISIRTAGAVSSASINVTFLYLAIVVALVILVFAWKVIVGLYVALTAAAGFLVAVFRVVASLPVWLTVHLRWLLTALATAVDKIFGAVATLVATYFGAKWAVAQQVIVMRNLLIEERSGTAYQTPVFSPNGNWPNPTRDVAFPHMGLDANGQWQVQTRPEYR
ncbi:MAG TPA: hypothetical protein VFC00_37050 [Micromonosporaceae bacterium]|nr:hypothetical protein [Micromonosporaceae bacterium]